MGQENGLHIAVVGATGAVGQQIIKTLENRNFPVGKLHFYPQHGLQGKRLYLKVKKLRFRKQNLKVLKG